MEEKQQIGWTHRFIADLEKDRQHATANQDYSTNQDSIALVLTQE